MYNVTDIANKIILNTDTEKGDIITNLKLQKILYYMQGYHLAFFDAPLFEQSIEAWAYGPVVPDAYHTFKYNGRSGISLNLEEVKEAVLSDEQNDMFWQVMTEYGKFSAIKLMDMTHEEAPWKEAINCEDKTIRHETMSQFFKELVDG